VQERKRDAAKKGGPEDWESLTRRKIPDQVQTEKKKGVGSGNKKKPPRATWKQQHRSHKEKWLRERKDQNQEPWLPGGTKKKKKKELI